MSHQLKISPAGSSLNVTRTLGSVGIIAVYFTLALGYRGVILQGSHLTAVKLLSFTILQVGYALVLVWFFKVARSPQVASLRSRYLLIALLTVLALTSGLLSASFLQFDWPVDMVLLTVYCAILPFRVAIALSLLICLAAGINSGIADQWHWSQAFSDWIGLLLLFAFVAFCLLLLRVLNAQKRQAEELLHRLEQSNAELAQAHQQLQRYADEVEELAIMRERTRLAREIHDALGHYLSVLHMQLEAVSKWQERDPARALAGLAEARQFAAQALSEVHNAVAALRPSYVENLSLTGALTHLGSEFEQTASEICLTLDLDTPLPSLSPEVQVALYRVAQEALTNVRKHAHASKVLLRLRYEDEELELLVLDNGSGTAAGSEQVGGFGLVGLHERLEALGGCVSYGPAEPQGYRVVARIRVASGASPAVQQGQGRRR
jgi:signal transduction histidine kinase